MNINLVGSILTGTDVMHDYINSTANITSTIVYQTYSNSFVIKNTSLQDYTLYITPTYTSSSLQFGSISVIAGKCPQTILHFTTIG